MADVGNPIRFGTCLIRLALKEDFKVLLTK